MTGKSVVVTGVSTGIGHGITSVLIRKGFTVFGTVRKQADADRLQTEFGAAFTPLLVDVTDQAAVTHAAGQVREALGSSNLAGLVNNAGMSMLGPLLYAPLYDFRHQLEINLIAPLLVTQAFAGLLGTDLDRQGGPGRILNISSVGGKLGAPFIGAYAASKHGLEGMSESLRRELLLFGIDVVLIAPGYVNTPILDKAGAEDLKRYAHTRYAESLDRFRKFFITEGRKGLAPEVVGEAVHTALTVSKPKVRYAVVKQKFQNWTVPMLLPKRLLDRLMGKQLGLIPLKHQVIGTFQPATK